jgi:steroid delta-isomerase-like uncharacterized protein
MLTQQEIRNRSRTAIEAWNRHDPDGLVEDISEDSVMIDTALGEVRGKDALRDSARLYMEAFPDLHLEVDLEIVEGDVVCQEWTATGTHDGPLMGIEPTGRRVVVRGCNVTRYDGDHVEAHRYWNPGEMLAQIQG